jgi:lipopolysaccharide heptosyltransferase II
LTDTLNKTLIIRFSSVGDIVLSSLLVRAFRSRYPNSQLDFVVKEEFADVVRFNPHLSNVITLLRESSFADLRKLRSRIHNTNYDLIIDIHGSLRSRYLCFGARRVVRINKRKLARFLLVKFKKNLYDNFSGAPSVALRYLEPVREFGVEDDGRGLEFFFSNDVKSRVEGTVRGSGFEVRQQFIGVCPSAKHTTKMWLKERFAEAASALSKKHNQPIVLFGSGDDEVKRCKEIEEMIHDLNPEPKTLNLSGKLSLAETAAMMDNCSIIITNDTGLMHVAAARKRNVVAIFGSTVKELGFYPFGTNSTVVENKNLDCRPCTYIGLAECPKGHFKCMSDISTEQVIASANTLLQ